MQVRENTRLCLQAWHDCLPVGPRTPAHCGTLECTIVLCHHSTPSPLVLSPEQAWPLCVVPS